MNEPTESRRSGDRSHHRARRGSRRPLPVRYDVRILDPASAVRIPGQRNFRSTAYVGDRLVMRGLATDSRVLSLLVEAAGRNGARVLVDDRVREISEFRRQQGLASVDRPTGVVGLVSLSSDASAPPDAWSVLQTYRQLAGDDADLAHAVALDHLMMRNTDIEGAPKWSPTGISGAPKWSPTGIDGLPKWSPTGIDGLPKWSPTGTGGVPKWSTAASPAEEYGFAGAGGRQPVMWVGGMAPRRADADLPWRRPVVAVLDSGIGTNPWLDPSIVDHSLSVGPVGIGTDPDDPLVGILGHDAGHGTFIAGLIRQICPDVDILDLQIMGPDGIVAESDLLHSLEVLDLRQSEAQQQKDPGKLIDVISLSLGYYHEELEDYLFDPVLLDVLRRLGSRGVSVVASAGNDSTYECCFPAAFSPWSGGIVPATDPAVVPIVGVGALNPDGTVAMFSNAGEWVSCYAVGAALVSTFPTDLDGSLEATARTWVDGMDRSTIDPDNFAGGWGTWSGTSFAAPVIAGRIAQSLMKAGGLNDWSPAACVARGWAAVSANVPKLA